MFMSTVGGLNTNVNMQVCDASDAPLPGLYNVGQMTGNMYANNYNFAIPGNCYGINCITYGYLLGRDLADNKFDD
jgi:fumarate reductase flavoprotein subunit